MWYGAAIAFSVAGVLVATVVDNPALGILVTIVGTQLGLVRFVVSLIEDRYRRVLPEQAGQLLGAFTDASDQAFESMHREIAASQSNVLQHLDRFGSILSAVGAASPAPADLTPIKAAVWDRASQAALGTHSGLLANHLILYAPAEIVAFLRLMVDHAQDELYAIDFIAIDAWYSEQNTLLHDYLQAQLDFARHGQGLVRLRFVRREELADHRLRRLTRRFADEHAEAGAELLLVDYASLDPTSRFYPDTGSLFVDPDTPEAVLLSGRLGDDHIISKADVYFGPSNAHITEPLKEFHDRCRASRAGRTTERLLTSDSHPAPVE